MELEIQACTPEDSVVKPLLDALSEELYRITGNDGRSSFESIDTQGERSIFVVAKSNGEALGCGGLRPITSEICEIKRMYAKYQGKGIGSAILHVLEEYAQKFDYKEIWLETRKVNENAVRFYISQGYQIQDNYGKYIGRTDAICFRKQIEKGQGYRDYKSE